MFCMFKNIRYYRDSLRLLRACIRFISYLHHYINYQRMKQLDDYVQASNSRSLSQKLPQQE